MPATTWRCPAAMVSGQGEHYALEVKGDSMIEAGINDGDVVVIRETDVADNGDIVVALVEGQEATLKRSSAAATPSRWRRRIRPTRPASARGQGQGAGPAGRADPHLLSIPPQPRAGDLARGHCLDRVPLPGEGHRPGCAQVFGA